ncbi:MAG: hypothetical protein IPK79_08005 [Vampirovibrionales bacterium]|nr:hypothetical protein [Vampirovibrionales bacterium]
MSKPLEHLGYWEAAMRCGLMGGRPFSEGSIKNYVLYARWYLNAYEELDLAHVKTVMLTAPVGQFAKRLKIYESLRCLGKYLIEQGELDAEFLKQMGKYKPRRYLPPRKLTVDESGIERLLTFCDKPLDRIIVELLSQTGGYSCGKGLFNRPAGEVGKNASGGENSSNPVPCCIRPQERLVLPSRLTKDSGVSDVLGLGAGARLFKRLAAAKISASGTALKIARS